MSLAVILNNTLLEDLVWVWLIAFAILLYIVWSSVEEHLSKNRRLKMKRWAAQSGFEFLPKGPNDLCHQYGFSSFEGTPDEALNVCIGRIEKYYFKVIDFISIGAKGQKHRKSLVVFQCPFVLSSLLIRRRDPLDGLSEFFHRRRRFLGTPEFKSRFTTVAKDPAWAQEILKPGLCRLISDHPRFIVEFDALNIAVYKQWRQLRPDVDLDDAVELGAKIVDELRNPSLPEPA
jgi:hypothetical protein